MELLQLRYFYESSQNENFSQTAQKHMVPVSSVSASVRRLEQELGCTLFDRCGNKIFLNKNGIRLQGALCIVFDELKGAIEDISVPYTDKREIKILIRSVRSDITDFIIEYSKKYPHISFKTVFDSEDAKLEDYNVIIDERSDFYKDYSGFEILNMKIYLKASKENPLVGKKISLNKLNAHPFISLSDNSNMHRLLVDSCKKAGFVPNVVAQINDISCYDKMIESGIGIGLGRDDPASESIKSLDVADFDKRYIVYAYYKKQDSYGNIKHFLDFLKNKASNNAKR